MQHIEDEVVSPATQLASLRQELQSGFVSNLTLARLGWPAIDEMADDDILQRLPRLHAYLDDLRRDLDLSWTLLHPKVLGTMAPAQRRSYVDSIFSDYGPPEDCAWLDALITAGFTYDELSQMIITKLVQAHEDPTRSNLLFTKRFLWQGFTRSEVQVLARDEVTTWSILGTRLQEALLICARISPKPFLKKPKEGRIRLSEVLGHFEVDLEALQMVAAASKAEHPQRKGYASRKSYRAG